MTNNKKPGGVLDLSQLKKVPTQPIKQPEYEVEIELKVFKGETAQVQKQVNDFFLNEVLIPSKKMQTEILNVSQSIATAGYIVYSILCKKIRLKEQKK